MSWSLRSLKSTHAPNSSPRSDRSEKSMSNKTNNNLSWKTEMGQQLKRKFVPPTKSDRNGLNSGAVGSNGGGFNPGRSVKQHLLKKVIRKKTNKKP